jgi:prepilin-type N-terminal cleavage/methylation domain-containing protein
MRRNIPTINKKGFSLLELSVVIIIISILASYAIPSLTRAYLEKASEKTAAEILTIEEASRDYFVNNASWPGTIAGHLAFDDLKNGNYLPTGWVSNNPFGNPYSINSTGPLLSVSTIVRDGAQVLTSNKLPTSTVTGTTVTSSVPAPGSSNNVPVGTVVPWPSDSIVPPTGFLFCDGTVYQISDHPGLFAVISNNFGGDGIVTFAVPDIRSRNITGQDGMAGSSLTNRITMWGSGPSRVGGTFGEDKHQLTIAEMPSHHHGYNETPWLGSRYDGHSSPVMTGQIGSQTSDTGGNQSHNIVSPSISMPYIIKT